MTLLSCDVFVILCIFIGDSFRNDENKGDKFEDAEDSMEENGNTNTSHKSENNEHQHSLENNQTQLESVTSSTQSKIDIFVCTEGENIVVGRTTISDSIGDEPGKSFVLVISTPSLNSFLFLV